MSLSPPIAAEFASELSRAVVNGDETEWPRLEEKLAQLSGRDWLVLDAAARSYRLNYATAVSGVRGWLGPNLGEPSGLVAAVTSLHVDGRFRERAALALAGMSGGIAVSAAAVRLLDHVEQVRAAAPIDHVDARRTASHRSSRSCARRGPYWMRSLSRARRSGDSRTT